MAQLTPPAAVCGHSGARSVSGRPRGVLTVVGVSPTQRAKSRKRSPLARVAGLGLTIAACAACGQPPAHGYYGTVERRGRAATTFYLNNHSEPEYLDPGLSSDATSSVLLNDLFEGLVITHPDDLRPVQGVATHYDKSADNRIYRFYLRRDARWSDGKAVTAHDFVYAWRRVLRPETAARMVTLLYNLKNGKAFHQGHLKALRVAAPLRAAPRDSAAEVTALTKGSPVMVLKTSPVRVALTALLSAPVQGALRYQAAKGKAPASLRTAVANRSLLSGSADRSADIIALGPAVKCNEQDDHMYRIRRGDEEGWLPGCALKEQRDKAVWALVETFHGLPSYRPTAAAKVVPLRGFVAYRKLYSDIAAVGVRAAGDHVLEVELERPTPYFLELCSIPTLYPVRRDLIEHFDKIGRPDLWYRPENIISNGPYTLDEWQFQYELSFKRNPYHYDHDKLKLHRIVWLVVPSYQATMHLYRTGEIDYVGSNVSLPAAYMDKLPVYKDFTRSLYLSTYWYEMNTQKPPVDNVLVRRALNLAVNKQLLIDRITRAGQLVATHYVPDYTGSGYAEQAQRDKQAGHDPFRGPEREFNPARGRQLLREAGYEVIKRDGGWYAEGFPALEILYNTSEGHRKIAVAIQDMWKQHLGITVQLRNEEWKVMLKNLRDGHYQVARFGWVADYNHPHTWMDLFLSYSSNNRTHWGDPKVDAMIQQAAATADPRASIQLYRQAEVRALDAMSRLPLYFYTKSTLIKPYVKGFYPNATNVHQVRWMWIDKRWREGGKNVPAYAPRELPEPTIMQPAPPPPSPPAATTTDTAP